MVYYTKWVMSVRVIISAGGTGGHIYPAIAIINRIKKVYKDAEILYIGTHNRMEKDIIPSHNIPFESVEIYGFNRKKILKNIKTIKCLIEARKKCKKIIKDFKPDIVIGVGGYVTVPVITAAHKLGIKTFIHEQNSVAGKANLYLSKIVDGIGVSFESSKKDFPTYKTYFTGNPCSEEAVLKTPLDKSFYHLSKSKKLVLFVMGSLGSSKVNKILKNTMKSFKDKDYEVLFVTGKNDYDNIRGEKFPSNVFVEPYIEDMTRLLKNTDIIVSRAGASTLSEIIALKVPSILIPSPYVPNNHQYKNAMDLVENKAAILIEEKDLNESIIVDKIDNLINNDTEIKNIKNNLSKMRISNSATKIVDIIGKLVGDKND